MLFEPIPKRLLIHEVTYTEPTDIGDGSMGGGSKPKSTVIKNVRFTPTRKKVTKSDNTEAYTNLWSGLASGGRYGGFVGNYPLP